jgi:hypothetical protein
MSSIEQVNTVVMEVKVKAKSFAQKDKKTMFSILGFMLHLKEQGVLDEEKMRECMESLPLYQTAAEKTAFFQLDIFDTTRVEEELYKPMVLEHKNNKKQAKKEKKVKEPKEKKVKVIPEGEEKVKKPRVKKVKITEPVAAVEPVVEPVAAVEPVVEPVAVVEPVVEPVAVEKKTKKPRAKKEAVEGEDTLKRGRKPKQQLVEFAQEASSLEEEMDPLDALVDSMNSLRLESIQVEDIDDMLKELEAEEMVVAPTAVPANTPVKKDKKKKRVIQILPPAQIPIPQHAPSKQPDDLSKVLRHRILNF